MIISLTGFMGCGKSSVGRELARLLGWPLVDLDRYIEQKMGQRIAEIFDAGGEQRFRAIETEALRDIIVMHEVAGGDRILSLGGGTIVTAPARELLFKHTESVYLQTDLDTIFKRIRTHSKTRPLFNDKYKIESLFDERMPLYEQAAHSVRTDGRSPAEIAELIINQLDLKIQ